MKHKFLMLALLAMFTLGILPAWGQVGEYSFSATTGTFTPITGGVLLGTETSDDQRFVDPATPAGGTVTTGPGFDIGFNFTFNGAVFDRLSINNNGWISLGQSALTPSVNNTSSSAYTPIASTSVIDPPQLYNRIVALGRDLQAQTGASLRLETIGTAPNRVCVVQWLNYKKYGTSGTGDVLNFQIQLHETTNNVKIVYGVMTPNATAGNFQVGLRGPLATDFNARQGTTGWTNTTAATANTQYVVMDATNFPANGLTFSFDFPIANQAPNPANLVGPPDTGTLISPSVILSWLSGGGLPSGYRLSLGTNNPPTNILNNQDLGAVTNYDPNPDLQIATTYYWKVVPYNAFGDAANCPVWSFTTHGDPTVSSLPYTQNFDTAVTPPALPFDWTSIVQSSATAASVNTYGTTATYAHSLPNCARLQNSTDASAVVMLVGPQIGTALTPNTIRVKFWARAGSASNPVSVGMMTNPADPATYVELQNIPLTTTVAEYVVTLTSYTGEGRYFAFKHGLGGTSRTIYLDDVSFEQIAPNDLAAVSVTGNSTPTSGVAANYTVNLYNWGTATQNTYTVNLMSGDTVLATAPGTTIAPGTSAAVVVTWTPTTEGPVTIYGKVVLAGDINPANDTTSPITVAVQPAGAVVVTIGEGNEVDGIPYDFYYKNSIHEALYYEAEFSGVAGSITAVTFYNNFVSDLQNMPIKLWLGTTQLADLSAGWILPDQLTMVYNGTINLPAGQNSIVVPLQTPYLFTGGNLVLYANRPMDTQYYNTNDNFQVQTIGTNRGRILRSDSTEYDPANPSGAGTLSGKFAKTSFTFVVTDMGSLAGTVTSGATPIAGAAVQVVATSYATTTSATGQYSFPFLPVGNYQVSVSKIGYETLTLPVAISDGVVSTLNFNLTPSANITVSGTLRGSDAPTVGLVGATISLDGPVDYQGTSGAGGNFSIPGVLTGNTYNYIIEMVGYADLTGTITVGTTNYNMGTLIMTEEALPPVQIVATENTAQTQVALTWRPPGSGGGGAGEEDFEFDNGGWVPSSNWTNPLGDWEWGNNYDIDDFVYIYTGTSVIPPTAAHSGTGMWGTKFLTNYTNSGGFNYLTKTFNFTGVSNAQLKFWSWENIFGNFDYAQVSVNGTLVWGPSWDYSATQWRERIVDLSAYDGMAEVTIQFQMWATTTVNYAGWYIDDVYVGPAQTPVVRTTPASVMPAAFSKLSETDAAAMAENLYRSTPRERATQSSSNPSRSLIGYKVWRFIAGNENNEASWTLLTTANITDTTYVDLAWGAQTDGLYRWAVKGIYTNNVQGPVGFSNIIRIERNNLAANTITGSTTPTMGTAAIYTIGIENVGTQAKAAGSYTVKLMNGATELASVPGPNIAPAEELVVDITWTPTVEGPMPLTGMVVLPGDTAPANDTTSPLNISVMPEGTYMLVIGDGSQQARVPIDMYYKSSLYETIYPQSEINVGMVMGMINAVTFRKNFTSSDIPADRPIQIWLGTTTQTDLATDWIPASALTQVFNGTMNFTAGEGTVTFNFPTPYLYLGGNLVMMVFRPQDTQYYDSTDNFYAQTIGTNRTRKVQSDSTVYDPNAPTGGTPTGQFPQTFFHIIPGGVGHVNGTVRGPGNTPLAGVTVSFDHGGYNVTTNAQGQYAIQNVIVDDYQVSFSKHGYITQTLPLAIVEDQTHTLDATLALMPQVQVTGTILASDTGAGLAGATIYLTGYENYNANSTATGSFTFPAVFANQTYNYNIVCPGYMGATGTINVGAANHNMGQITLAEVAYPPTAVVAEANTSNTEVDISWTAPDPNSLNISEGFENATFPPVDWTQVITNTGPANANGVYPTWGRFGTITIGTSTVAPTEGAWQAGLWWSYEHQDEWLITPSFGVPPQALLSFDSYVFLGSTAGDHYYIKASTDNGQNWTTLWDASAQTGGWNYYTTPISVDLASYAGQQIKLAWNAVDPPSNDGLWYTWFIDDVYIGNQDTTIRFAPEEMSFVSTNANRAMTNTTQTLPSRAMQNGSLRGEPALPRMIRDDNDSTRALTGYKVWRLTSGSEATPDSWTLLTAQDITLTELTDPGWGTLANGDYRWAVKAVYTNNVLSAPAFSNILHKETLTGMISGLVRQTNNQPIPGATVTAGTYTATTNNSGAYVLIVPTGVYTVTASAANYQTGSQADVTVVHNQTTTVNFNLIPGSDADDPNTPVASTTLVGNYPNPFNPRTTLRYDLKDNSHVRIDIYNYRGQLVKTLVNTDKAAGRHSVDWDGTDQQGMPVSSGVYYYKMFSGSYSSTRKMVLMK